MKRILSLFLAFVLILSTFASCSLFPNKVEETDIAEAVAELKDMYKKTQNTAIADGKELAAQIKVGSTIFNIEWTSNNDSITVENLDGMAVVRINSDAITETTNYTLTANITSEGGQKATFELNLVVTVSFGMITAPEAGVAYKLALLHGNEKAVVYFDGENYNGYAWYLNYTTDILAAVDVYLETVEGVEGGYRLYFDKNGEKTYIRAYPRDGDTAKVTLELTTAVPAECYTYSTEYNTLVYTSTTGEQFYLGSSGTYKSISGSAITYISGATSYPCRLYGAGGVEEKLPEQELPTVPENYTSKDIVEALYKLESGQTLEGPYEFTGVITSFKYAYDPAYNNVSVNIVVDGMTDKPVLCYRLNGGEELEVGDTITVFAGITNYNGTYETTSGGVIRKVVKGEGTPDDGGETPDGGETAGSAVLDLTGNANLVTGSAAQNVFAANGITLTNDKASSTSDLTVQAEYAQRFYAGSTITIEYTGMTKIVLTLDDFSDGKYLKGFDGMTVEGATITRDNDVVTIVFDAPTNTFTSGNFASQIRCEKIEVYTGEVEGGNGGNEGGGDEGGDDPVVTPAYTAPVAGQPYDLYMELPTGKVYFNGSLDAAKGTYLDTTADASASIKIYFEEVSGGYHIFFMNGETKTYINAEAYLKSNGYAGCHFTLGETSTCVWTYNTELGILEVYGEISGKSDTFFAGTYGSYSTVSLSGAYYKDQIATGTQYPARIEAAEGEVIPPSQGGEGGEVTPPEGGEGGEVTPPEGGDDAGEDDGIWTIPEVLASADGTDVVITGVVIIAEAWNTQYKNMSVTIKDAERNTLYVYRLATQVGLGDTITITGKVGSYNDAKQIAAGATAVIDVVHGDNHTYEDGKCTICESAEPVVGEETIKCDFSTLAAGTQYADETVTFGDYITVSTHNKGCHFNTQLRIYASDTNNGNAVIASTNVISSLVINAGYKNATLEVYGSVDGTTWVPIKNVTTTTSYANHTVDIDNTLGYKYIKLDATGAQVRVASIDVTIVK